MIGAHNRMGVPPISCAHRPHVTHAGHSFNHSFTHSFIHPIHSHMTTTTETKRLTLGTPFFPPQKSMPDTGGRCMPSTASSARE